MVVPKEPLDRAEIQSRGYGMRRRTRVPLDCAREHSGVAVERRLPALSSSRGQKPLQRQPSRFDAVHHF
jgi:hypothetical protein